MTSQSTSIRRRHLLAAASAFGLMGSIPVLAQDNSLRLSVGFPPGGSGDLFARFLADALREELGRAVVVENRPGGGGMTVATTFLRAPKDGNHLMLATGSTAISAPISRAKAPYNPVDDFQWIALMSNAPFVIALHPSVPVRDLPGLVAYCKDNPGKLTYGHAGLGTTVHLAGELFKDMAGIKILDVPYAGSAPAINDTIAGTVQMNIETSATLLPHHKSGRLRIICTMAEAREKIAPEIPTAREAGMDLIAGTCNLLAAPLGTAPQLLEPIARAVSRVMEKPAVVERLLQQGIQPISNSNPAQARAFVTSEVARWSAVVKKLGIAL
jgi:tripartite-type tricarboxylate transporter receptor subunit TctC